MIGALSVKEFSRSHFIARACANFEIEEIFAAGDRCVVRSVYRRVDGDGKPGHVRGAILFRVRDGKITENPAYVKG